MDFTFNEEQIALQQVARQALEREVTPEVLRRLADSEEGTTPGIWSGLVEMGWTAMLVPESLGGTALTALTAVTGGAADVGGGLLEACIVLEQMGRIPMPGPFLSSAVMATLAARSLGLHELVSSLASGRARGTVACQEMGGGDPLSTVRSRARRKGTGWVVSGTKPLVLDGHTADWAIVVARADDELRSFLLPEPHAVAVPTLDPTRKAAHLVLDETPVDAIGPAGSHGAVWRRVLDDVAVALASESVGVAHRALDEAVAYASRRIVFDRPIATFQAVKHRIVDMFQSVEMARVGAQFAAWASDTGATERVRATAMAASYATRAAVRVTGDNIQVHGGVGFTWEDDAHFLFKRAKMNETLVGGPGFEQSRLEEMLLSPA